MSYPNISRRNFIKVAVGTAALSLAGCKPASDREAAAGSSPQSVESGRMTYRTNPRTGDEVSLLGFGCMRFPTVDNNPDNPLDQEAINRLIDYAIEHGVNYFDTSPVYCKGKSEEATGIALARHPRDKWLIATKLSNFDPATQSREASIAMYRNSLANLQTDHIDYMLLHAVGGGDDPLATFNQRFIDNGILDFLVAEREAGRIRNLGFSFHGDIRVFEWLLDNHDKYNWDFVQIQLNYVDWNSSKAPENRNVNAEYLYGELEKRNIPAVIMEPLLGGRLASLNNSLTAELKQRRPDDSVASWAFRFAGTPEGVLTVLSGMTYMDHLQDNLRTYSPLQPVTQDEQQLLRHVADIYAHHPLVGCTGCQYCVSWCKYGIDIPAIFTHYNKCINDGNVPDSDRDPEYAAHRRAFLVGYDRAVPRLRQASHCIRCGACVPHCPQEIDIPATLAQIDEFAERLRRNA